VSAVAGNLLLDDSTWDLYLEAGNLVVSSGHDAVRQAVNYRLLFFRGEWFMDENEGMPYWSDIFIKNPNLPAIREITRAKIAGTPGIDSVQSISLERDTGRTYKLSFVAKQYDDTLLVTDSFALGAP
jgi:hypothetical protein